MGGTSTYHTTGSGLDSTRSESGKSDFYYGVEFRKSVYRDYGVALAVESFQWVYPDNTPSDKMRQITLIIRQEQKIPGTSWNFWGGIGLGALMIDLGQIGATSGGTTVRANNSTYTTFLASPRIGLDYAVANKLFFGGSLNFGYAQFNLDSSAYNGAGVKTASYNIDTIRSWWGVAFNVGFSL